jgi:hypothetical protein
MHLEALIFGCTMHAVLNKAKDITKAKLSLT